MKPIKQQKKLPKDVKEALEEIYQRLGGSVTILKLVDKILTREEARRAGRVGIEEQAPPSEWVSVQKIVEVVAQQRKLTKERALLELARSLDMIGVGRYEELRRAIGQPVVPERDDVPQWDDVASELRYKGRVVRLLSVKAVNCRQVFNAFQGDGWPVRIDSPLPGGKDSSKLRETVRTLNDGLSAIKFFCDGSGEGVIWQEC